jgi:hypothetical protein
VGFAVVQLWVAASILNHQTWIESEQKWQLLDWGLLGQFGLAPNGGYLADLGVAVTHRGQGIATECPWGCSSIPTN